MVYELEVTKKNIDVFSVQSSRALIAQRVPDCPEAQPPIPGAQPPNPTTKDHRSDVQQTPKTEVQRTEAQRIEAQRKEAHRNDVQRSDGRLGRASTTQGCLTCPENSRSPAPSAQI